MKETAQILLKRMPNNSMVLDLRTRGQIFLKMLNRHLTHRSNFQSSTKWFAEWKLTSNMIKEAFS